MPISQYEVDTELKVVTEILCLGLGLGFGLGLGLGLCSGLVLE